MHAARKLVFGMLGAWFAAATVLSAAEATNAAAPLFTLRNKLPCHTAAYGPCVIAWTPVAAVRDVRAVYPHPAVADTVYALCGDGLFRSDDDGASWRRLPLAGLASAVALTDVAFRPGDPETFCLGTRSNGVWLTTDGGKTARLVGSQKAGMASDAVVSLFYAAHDPFSRTVIAAHGTAAGGLSRGDTEDGAWTVLAPEYFVRRVIPATRGARDLYVFASEKDTPDAVSLYYTSLLGEFWQRLASDILPTDGARLPDRDEIYVTTLDKGVYCVADKGALLLNEGGADREWFSVGATWGQHADEARVYLYQPSRQGLVLLPTNGLAAAADRNGGPYTGAFVSEGSHIRANAGGARFYAAVNGSLWVGSGVGPLRVERVTLTPPVVTFAASVLDDARWRSYDEDVRGFATAARAAPLAPELVTTLRTLRTAIPTREIAVQARVVAPSGTLAVVTADLSRFGLPAESPMADDGAHGDGTAGDGIYGTAFELTQASLRKRSGDWRAPWPGPLAVTVTARIPGQAPAGAVGVFSLYSRPESFALWTEGKGLYLRDATGTVAFDCVLDPPHAAAGSWYVRLDVGPGAWQAPLGHPSMKEDLAEYYALTFLIRSKGPADKELFVHLRDNPTYTYPTVTPGVPVVAGGYVTGGAIVTQEYRRVTIPVAELLRGSNGFFADLVGWVVFSGDSPTQRSYLIDDIRFYATKKEFEAGTRAKR